MIRCRKLCKSVEKYCYLHRSQLQIPLLLTQPISIGDDDDDDDDELLCDCMHMNRNGIFN